MKFSDPHFLPHFLPQHVEVIIDGCISLANYVIPDTDILAAARTHFSFTCHQLGMYLCRLLEWWA